MLVFKEDIDKRHGKVLCIYILVSLYRIFLEVFYKDRIDIIIRFGVIVIDGMICIYQKLRRLIMRGRYFIGLFLILLGIGFLMDQFGYFDFGDLMSTYWPSILILLGISGLLDRKSSKTGSLILIAIGLMFQVNNLDILEVNVFRLFWPIILIIIGLNLIFSKGIVKHSSPVEPEKWSSENIDMEDTVNQVVIFSGNSTANQSSSFKGGRLTALFGGIDLDLRGAQLNEDQAFLDVTAAFGGVDIKVPDTWRVDLNGTPILGGIDNSAKPNPDPDAPVLKISATAIFGGIDISN